MINDTECQSIKLTMIDTLLSDILSNSSLVDISTVEAVSKEVSDLTNVTTGITPNDLNTTNNIIDSLIEYVTGLFMY